VPELAITSLNEETMTAYPGSVDYEVVDRIATITINNPEKRNSLNATIRQGLWDAFARLQVDDTARVGVLTGAGDSAFCAGADLHEMSSSGMRVPPVSYVPMLGRSIVVDKPVIAAVNGHAIGGGLLLSLLCDMVVASQNATFGAPEARWGRGAPWSVPLQWMMSNKVWMEIALLGQPISAQRAYEAGLVNVVTETPTEAREQAHEMAGRLTQVAPLTMAATLQMVRRSPEMSQTSAWDLADALFVPVYVSDDAQEGPRSFREGREANWKGA